jgi:hypothetical protein
MISKRTAGDELHAAALPSLSALRRTIVRASSGNGRCGAFAPSHGARISERANVNPLGHQLSRRLSGETAKVMEFGGGYALSHALGCVCGNSSLVQLPVPVHVWVPVGEMQSVAPSEYCRSAYTHKAWAELKPAVLIIKARPPRTRFIVSPLKLSAHNTGRKRRPSDISVYCRSQ